MARSQQLLHISTEECLSRAALALQREGYLSVLTGGPYLFGRKPAFGVYILCDAAPKSMTRVSILVAAVAADEVPAQEVSTRLQDRMEQDDGPLPADGPAPLPAQPGASEAPVELGGSGWQAIAREVGGEVGRRFLFKCPPAGTLGPVWGTDVYTHDSSVCTAALHSGAITLPRAGNVIIEIRPGQSAYPGSRRNGVVTESYGAWYVSFVVVGRAP